MKRIGAGWRLEQAFIVIERQYEAQCELHMCAGTEGGEGVQAAADERNDEGRAGCFAGALRPLSPPFLAAEVALCPCQIQCLSIFAALRAIEGPPELLQAVLNEQVLVL